MVVKHHVQDIELFVSIQDAHMRKEPEIKKREIANPVVEKKTDPEPVREIVRSVAERKIEPKKSTGYRQAC